MRETQRKGDVAVAQAVASFTKLGYEVALPLTESAPYDLLVDSGRDVHRVQVRFTSGKEVDLRRIHSNSKGYVVKKTRKNAYDWLYILKSDDTEYLIKQCLDSRRSVNVHEKYKIVPRFAAGSTRKESSQEKNLIKDIGSSAII